MFDRSLFKVLFVLMLLFAAAGIGRLAVVEADDDRYQIFFPMGANNFVGSLPGNRITDIEIYPPSPADMALFDRVTVSFNYATDEEAGVRIWAVPFTNGDWSPGYGYQGSDIIPRGEGRDSRWFFITSGTVTVDQIRLHMKSADGSRLLYEEFIPVNYHYSD